MKFILTPFQQLSPAVRVACTVVAAVCGAVANVAMLGVLQHGRGTEPAAARLVAATDAGNDAAAEDALQCARPLAPKRQAAPAPPLARP